jgi:hypothetical protein
MPTQLCDRNLNSEMYKLIRKKIKNDVCDMIQVLCEYAKEKKLVITVEDFQELEKRHGLILLSNWCDHVQCHGKYLLSMIEEGRKLDEDEYETDVRNVMGTVEIFLVEKHPKQYFIKMYEEYVKEQEESQEMKVN